MTVKSDNRCLFEFDNNIRNNGYKNICGIDEAGRGPLAGPVFAAAVILPKDIEFEFLNDSKKISEKKRNILFDQITEKALYYNISASSEQEIDEYNILNATYLAMERAALPLFESSDIILIDGNKIPPKIKENFNGRVDFVIKGDATSASIAAASILAKVSRDRYMQLLDKKYPQYKFAQHKGYGTKLHYQMLDEFGISPVHRMSFLKKYLANK